MGSHSKSLFQLFCMFETFNKMLGKILIQASAQQTTSINSCWEMGKFSRNLLASHLWGYDGDQDDLSFSCFWCTDAFLESIMQYDPHSIWRCLCTEGAVAGANMVIRSLCNQSQQSGLLLNVGYKAAGVLLSEKSSGSLKVTVHYRGWILLSYVYDTQMEREWVGGYFCDFEVQL